jgi:hypothetical protein
MTLHIGFLLPSESCDSVPTVSPLLGSHPFLADNHQADNQGTPAILTRPPDHQGRGARPPDTPATPQTDSAAQSDPSPPPSDPFDPERLRLTQDFGSSVGIKKLLTTMPVRKPAKEWWIRTHPDQTYRIQTAVVELKEDREIYLVDPSLWSDIAVETTFSPRLLVMSINRQGTLFLWPIRLPGSDGKLDNWNRSALEAAEAASKAWVRVAANMSLGAYDILQDWGTIQDRLIQTIDRDYGVFEGRTFKAGCWADWLTRHQIPWPLLESGEMALDDDTFRDMARAYPAVALIREVRHALSQMRLADLKVGADGRNRVL